MEIVVRSAAIFVFLFLLTRGLRRRTLADMAPFELILLVVIGDIVQQAVTQEDMSITGAVLATLTFAGLITVLSFVTWRSRTAARWVEGVPVVIVRDGRPVDEALANERLPIDEVLEAARQDGIQHLDDVKLAVLEPTGRVSFLRGVPSADSGYGAAMINDDAATRNAGQDSDEFKVPADEREGTLVDDGVESEQDSDSSTG